MPVDALRERGFAGAVRQVSEETFDLLEPVTGVKKACELTGKSRGTVYRRRNGTRSGCREQRPAAPNALSAGERGELLAVLDSPRFADKAPRQVWALLIDEGVYLASVATMYRLLRGAGQVRERRAQAVCRARTDAGGDVVTLESYVDDRFGFLRFEVDESSFSGRYFTVPRPQEPFSKGSQLVDLFKYDWKAKRYVPNALGAG